MCDSWKISSYIYICSELSFQTLMQILQMGFLKLIIGLGMVTKNYMIKRPSFVSRVQCMVGR